MIRNTGLKFAFHSITAQNQDVQPSLQDVQRGSLPCFKRCMYSSLSPILSGPDSLSFQYKFSNRWRNEFSKSIGTLSPCIYIMNIQLRQIPSLMRFISVKLRVREILIMPRSWHNLPLQRNWNLQFQLQILIEGSQF